MYRRIKIVADSNIPFLEGIFEPYADIDYIDGKDIVHNDIVDADALIIRTRTRCNEALLAGTKVSLIATATIGTDHIDMEYCKTNGIRVYNAQGCNAGGVMQYVFTGLYGTASRNGIKLDGMTLGIIGVGNVGKKVEHMARYLGFNVLRCDPPRAEREGEEGFVSMDYLVANSNIVTMHTPLDETTKGMADNRFFELMQPGAFFINASRGEVVDENALMENRMKLGPVIIDTWNNEPNINTALLDMADIATPHIAGFSADGKANATRMCLEEIERFFHIRFDRLAEVVPEPPRSASIDLRQWDDRRVEHAVLACFDPTEVDRRLREAPGNFEYFRNHYEHPREPQAYSLVGLRREEKELARQVGFRCVTEEHPDAL